MTRNRLFLIAMTLLSISVPGITLAETKLAVVNIPDVSDKYRKTADLEGHFEKIRQQANQKRQEIKDRIDRTQRSLQEEVKPGTEAYRARLKDLAMMQAELKWYTEVEGQRIEKGLASSLREIFEDIRRAIHAIAEERGLDIVIASDRLPKDGPTDPGQVRQQILLQKVLYWSPKTDITEEVISRLNANYKGPATSGSGGSTAPKAAPADDHR